MSKKQEVVLYFTPQFGGCEFVDTPQLTSLLSRNKVAVMHAINLLNIDLESCQKIRKRGGVKRDFVDTREALDILLSIFRTESKYLKRTLPRKIELIPHQNHYMLSKHKQMVIDTASVKNGIIQFSVRGICSESFQKDRNHLGENHPSIYHYSALMLHEFGHIIHTAMLRLPHDQMVEEMKRIMSSQKKFAKCWNTTIKVSRQNRSEWFADIVMRELMRVKVPGIYSKNE